MKYILSIFLLFGVVSMVGCVTKPTPHKTRVNIVEPIQTRGNVVVETRGNITRIYPRKIESEVQ